MKEKLLSPALLALWAAVGSALFVEFATPTGVDGPQMLLLLMMGVLAFGVALTAELFARVGADAIILGGMVTLMGGAVVLYADHAHAFHFVWDVSLWWYVVGATMWGIVPRLVLQHLPLGKGSMFMKIGMAGGHKADEIEHATLWWVRAPWRWYAVFFMLLACAYAFLLASSHFWISMSQPSAAAGGLAISQFAAGESISSALAKCPGARGSVRSRINDGHVLTTAEVQDVLDHCDEISRLANVREEQAAAVR